MGKHQVFLCLGGNLGDRAEIFRVTTELLERQVGALQKASPRYETPPWGFESELPFWNQVLLLETALLPEQVLTQVQFIENYFGRERQPGKYLSRKMDIDILFYDRMIRNTPELTIPHPLMAVRRFVLQPLADIAPRLVHPVTGQTVAEMLAACTDPAVIKRCCD